MRRTFAVGLILTFMFSVVAFANQGVFMVVKGDIHIVSKTGQDQKAKVGSKVEEGDTIVAGADSRAKIVMVDKNILNISPDTKVAIEKYQFDPTKDDKNVALNVLYGKVRSTVNQKYDGEKNSFNIKTPSAVAGVRGTDFITGFNPVTNATKIVTFEGQVVTGTGFGSGGKILNPVAVNPGQFTIASGGAPPAKPVAVPKSELASMNNESKADAPVQPANGNGNGKDKREPSSDGKGGDKGGEKAPGPTSMGVDSRDITADNGPAPAGAPIPNMMDCANCHRPETGFPQQLPTEFLNNGPTRLIINVQ